MSLKNWAFINIISKRFSEKDFKKLYILKKFIKWLSKTIYKKVFKNGLIKIVRM